MKKVLAVFALVAFLGVSTAPVFAASEKNTVVAVDDKPKAKKAEKKSDANCEAKCSESKSCDKSKKAAPKKEKK